MPHSAAVRLEDPGGQVRWAAGRSIDNGGFISIGMIMGLVWFSMVLMGLLWFYGFTLVSMFFRDDHGIILGCYGLLLVITGDFFGMKNILLMGLVQYL